VRPLAVMLALRTAFPLCSRVGSMEQTSWKSRIQKGILVLLVLMLAYFVFTNSHGKPSMPTSGSQALTRVENGFGSMANWFRDGAADKNRRMQQVHDNRETRVEDRVDESGGNQ
jgi:Na+(H+)/acetate symporter ActP